ncbi:MAG TPA: glycosyltransferase family 87 protein [Candidatus Sumerlaeota bacterium]|nr:glycosyltransferase family 87 protein [Candidatus Sumerlaeota bacterium]
MRDSRPAQAAWGWRALFWAAVVGYVWVMLVGPLRSEPFRGSLHGNDFKHLYLGAWMLPRGMDPYDEKQLFAVGNQRGFQSLNPYVYPPFTGLVVSPLGLMDPYDALRVWFGVNHLLFLSGLALTVWSLGLGRRWEGWAVAMLLAAFSSPLYRTLTAGQLNCVLFFCYAAVFALLKRRRNAGAGAVAAFAFLFKLAPGILLPYFGWQAIGDFFSGKKAFGSAAGTNSGILEEAGENCIRRHDHGRDARVPSTGLSSGCMALEEGGSWGRAFWKNAAFRSALWMVLFTAVFLALSVVWVGWDQHRAFRPLLEQMGYGRSTWAHHGMAFYRDAENQSFNSLFHHLFVASDSTTPWVDLGAGWANGLTRVALGICGLLVLWRTWPGRRVSREMGYGLFILLGLLAPSICWDHYAVMLVWPLLACYTRLAQSVRIAALCIFVGLVMAGLGLIRLQTWGVAPVGAAAGVGVWLVVRKKGAGMEALLWGLAAGCVSMRFPFGAPVFSKGVGLLGMSVGLGGMLTLFALCLILARESDDRGNDGEIVQEKLKGSSI